MNFEGKRILITGAAGFIGSNLTDKFIELGAEVIGIDNLFNGRLENLDDAKKNKKFTFHKGDIRDMDFLLELFKDIDIIYHEAAFTSVPQSVKMPENCNDVNVNGTISVLNAARRSNVEKVVFASSSAVYGDTPTLPKNEEMQRWPISPYGTAKLACEQYFKVWYLVYGLKTTSLRYFNVYGPKQRDSPYSGVIAIWLGKILRNENLLIFGDGEQSRDFTYVKDVLQGNLLVAEHDVAGEIINIACGNPITVNNLAKLMLKLTGKENLKIEHTDSRLGDIKHSYGDISKAKKLLGFEAKYTQEEGLRDFLNWCVKKEKLNLKIK